MEQRQLENETLAVQHSRVHMFSPDDSACITLSACPSKVLAGTVVNFKIHRMEKYFAREVVSSKTDSCGLDLPCSAKAAPMMSNKVVKTVSPWFQQVQRSMLNHDTSDQFVMTVRTSQRLRRDSTRVGFGPHGTERSNLPPQSEPKRLRGFVARAACTDMRNDNDNDTLREVRHPSNEGLALQARV